MDNEQKPGDVMIPTRVEILAELRAAQIDFDCTLDEARAVMELELVHQVKEGIELLRDEIKTQVTEIANDRRAKIAEAWILTRHNADRHASAEFEEKRKEIEGERRK
jgi:hypothetical protein